MEYTVEQRFDNVQDMNGVEINEGDTLVVRDASGMENYLEEGAFVIVSKANSALLLVTGCDIWFAGDRFEVYVAGDTGSPNSVAISTAIVADASPLGDTINLLADIGSVLVDTVLDNVALKNDYAGLEERHQLLTTQYDAMVESGVELMTELVHEKRAMEIAIDATLKVFNLVTNKQNEIIAQQAATIDRLNDENDAMLGNMETMRSEIINLGDRIYGLLEANNAEVASRCEAEARNEELGKLFVSASIMNAAMFADRIVHMG